MKQRFILPYEVETKYIQIHLLLCTCIDGLFSFPWSEMTEMTWSRLLILGWPRKWNSLTWKMSITKNHTQGHKFVPKKIKNTVSFYFAPRLNCYDRYSVFLHLTNSKLVFVLAIYISWAPLPHSLWTIPPLLSWQWFLESIT